MKQTPQIRLVFTLTRRDRADFDWDAVTRGLGFAHEVMPADARKREDAARGKEIVSRMSKCCPALQFSGGSAALPDAAARILERRTAENGLPSFG